jgi:hypothetical protein
MKLKYYIWTSIILAIHFFCSYYVMLFCVIYKNSSKEWLIGCFMTLGIDFLIISPIICILKVLLRFLVRTYPSRFTFWLFNYFQYITMLIDC